jgi:ATP-binding cassette subfamily F protein 3
MIILTVDGLIKQFGSEPVLNGVSFDVRAGEKLALVGPNGTGKSTLMKILAGIDEADSGRIDKPDSTSLAYLEQHPEFPAGKNLWQVAEEGLNHLVELTTRFEQLTNDMAAAADETLRHKLSDRYDRLQEQILMHDAYNLDHRIERVLHGLGFDESAFEQDVSTLSGGQKNRALLAQLLLSGADILLLDEPSNHLDIEATEWLEGFLQQSKQAVILVSHDRYLLDRVTDRTLELFQGTIDSYPGNFTAYWKQKEERLKVQQRTYEKQQESIAKTEDFIRRNFYGQKAAQAKDREKKLARMSETLVAPPRDIVAPPMNFPPADRTGDVVLRCEGLTKGYDRILFQDLKFEIKRGERWGILGPNGTGKTTLLRCLVGHETLDAGVVKPGAHVKIAYYDQLLSGLKDTDEVVEAVRPPHKEFNEKQRRDMLARFGITGEMVMQKVGSLSGGERSRANLARIATLDANTLILDEPTNHLDLWARDALERALNAFDGTLIFVSHDRYFLNRVADHLLVVEPGRFRVIEGTYETYQHLVKEGLALDARTTAKTKKSDKAETAKEKARSESNEPAKRKRKFPYRKVADIEAEIAQREATVEKLHAELADPDVLRDGERVKEAQMELMRQEIALASLLEHWEEACELNPS